MSSQTLAPPTNGNENNAFIISMRPLEARSNSCHRFANRKRRAMGQLQNFPDIRKKIGIFFVHPSALATNGQVRESLCDYRPGNIAIMLVADLGFA